MSRIHTYDPRFSAIKRKQRNGKNASTMLQDNRNLILQLIRKSGSISRKQLSEESGLQLATVTIIIKELLAQGLILEGGFVDGGNGRRVKSFSMAENLYTVVIRLTEVYYKIALFDIHIQPLYVKKVFFQTQDSIEEIMELTKVHIKEIEKQFQKEKILCIIVGVEHMYRLMNNDYVIWDEARQEYCLIGKKLHDHTGYNVFVNRAVNLSSYDMWDKCETDIVKKEDNYMMLVYVQLGYDLEGAIIVNHELLYGADGLCGQLSELKIGRDNTQAYKDVVTVPVLLKRAKELTGEYPDSYIAQKEDLNIRDVIAGYEKNDPLCRKVYNEVAEHLGYIFSQIISWMDPDVVMLMDEVPPIPEFEQVLRTEVARYCNEEKAERVHILIGERITKNDPVLVGGAKYAFDLLIGDIGIY